MKIGYVLDDSLDRPDGVQQYVTTLGQWFTEQGHEVHYLVSETHRTDLANIHSLAGSTNVRFNGNRMSLTHPISSGAASELLGLLALDVLHVQLPYSPLLGGKIIGAVKDEALVGTFHIMPKGISSRAGTWLLGKVQSRSLKRFDDLIACSKPAQEFAKSNYGISSSVVPNAVRLDAFNVESSKTEAQTRIVFLGRLVARKGCKYLLEAVTELKKDNSMPNFKVIIGGSGPLEGSLKQFVAENYLDDTVSFLGQIEETLKPKFLAEADIAVFPSTGGESFGIVLIEAMAAGAGVVIGADNAGYRSVLVDDEVLFEPASAQSLYEKLSKLVKDPSGRQSLHEIQQQRVKQYDVNVVGKTILTHYQAAIKAHRHPN